MSPRFPRARPAPAHAGRRRAWRSCVRSERAKRVACRFAIVEGNDAVGKLLSLLGSLARDEHDVAVPRLLDRTCNRSRAVELDLDIARHAGEDLVDDRLR